MNSEFILVKNDDNSGHLLLRVASIRGAEDDFTDDGKPDGCIIWYENEENCYSASTASEVLAAIQEAQGVVPRRVEGALAVGIGTGQDATRLAFWHNNDTIGPRSHNAAFGIDIYDETEEVPPLRFRHRADTSQVNGEKATRNTILAGPINWPTPTAGQWDAAIAEVRAQAGSCTCPHHQGDNTACPVHGRGTAWHDLHGDK